MSRSWNKTSSSCCLMVLIRGLLETELIFRRTAEPHDLTELGLFFSADDLLRAMEGASRRSPADASLPLQLRRAVSENDRILVVVFRKQNGRSALCRGRNLPH
jgi:hypothetical protein